MNLVMKNDFKNGLFRMFLYGEKSKFENNRMIDLENIIFRDKGSMSNIIE